MCGVVAFFGQSNGIEKVVAALNLLQYRAPDSTGIAAVDSSGRLALRRCVGPAPRLLELLAAEPIDLPPPAGAAQIVVGHGRWAMVGAVTAENAHPLTDRGGSRLVAENGSHNASLMLRLRKQQEAYWRRQGLPQQQPVHLSDNSTELIACEWERMARQLEQGAPPPGSRTFLDKMDANGIDDLEERALRLTMWRLRKGNAHAAAFYSLHRPGTLFVSSHNKPIAIVRRTVPLPSGGCRQELMVTSDVNAALMLWPPHEVAEAAQLISQLRRSMRPGPALAAEIAAVKSGFTLEVIYLDQSVAGGKQLLVRISSRLVAGQIQPLIQLSRYHGSPVTAQFQTVSLSPAMVQKPGDRSFAESHIAEIPEILAAIIAASRPSPPSDEAGGWALPGLRQAKLRRRFGPDLDRLDRIVLVGEGSSRQISLAAAPLFRQLLPSVETITPRPAEILNEGLPLDPSRDLIIEISWSGSTDSLRMVDDLAAAHKLMRLAITGRPDSDLGRRVKDSAGTVDTLTGIELSVSSLKGYPAGLFCAYLAAFQLAAMRAGSPPPDQSLTRWLQMIPAQIDALLADERRGQQIRDAADKARGFGGLVLVGDSPVCGEAQLKFQGMAQLMACALGFDDPGLGPLAQRSAAAGQTTLFVINAATPDSCRQALALLELLRQANQFCIVQTPETGWVSPFRADPGVAVFELPQTYPLFQPLLDVVFYYQFAVALAYARGLTADQIDRPRNLAKSVTTTSAEPRAALENRQEMINSSLADFASRPLPPAGEPPAAPPPMLTAALELGKLAGMGMNAAQCRRLPVGGEDRAARLGVRMAAAAWERLTGGQLVPVEGSQPSARLRIQTGHGGLYWHSDGTLRLPEAYPPWQRQLLAMLFFTGMGMAAGAETISDAAEWEAAARRSVALAAGMAADAGAGLAVRAALEPRISAGYDKIFVTGGGQDYLAAVSIAGALRAAGWIAAPLAVDAGGHGPLAVVGGPDPGHDALTLLLACDPLFQPGALVDAQVLSSRRAPLILLVPQGNEVLPGVTGVGAEAVICLPQMPRPFLPLIGAAWGALAAAQLNDLVQVVQ